jgi:hypothetical protein
MLDIFKTDAFSVLRMTEAMREIAYVPGRVGQLGLFQTESIDTLDVAIEKADAEQLVLVPSSPRGGPGDTRDFAKRALRKLSVPHFQRNDAIYADEVMQVRAFGSETAVETLQSKIAMKAVTHSQDFALTEEYHRLNIIKGGNLLDADGSVLYNYSVEFGETPPDELDWDLDNANPAEGALRQRCAAVTRAIATSLGGLPYRGTHAFCGDAFFDDLIRHREVRETYKGYAEAATLRAAYVNSGAGGSYGVFEFGGITWENYRGGGPISIDTDKVHIFPLGVPQLFKTIYAPADYIETVNRPGQRLYAKQWPMPNDKGVNLEYQMNALHYCTRPRVLRRGRRT